MSLQVSMDHLRRLAPVTGLIYVGAGSGPAIARFEDWNIPEAIFIEAEEAAYTSLARLVHGRPGWSARLCVAGNQEGEETFYVASNAQESSVFPPERLTGLWRNLKTREQRRVGAATVTGILSDPSQRTQKVNWAVVDCIPALPILLGAGRFIADFDVVLARAVLDESIFVGPGAAKGELDGLLLEEGFRCLVWEEEHHPAVGQVVYVRDWKAWSQLRVREVEVRASLQAEENARLRGALQNERADRVEAINEARRQVEEALRERDEQCALATQQQAEMVRLSQALEVQVRLADTRQQQLEQAVRERDEQSAVAAEREAKLAGLAEALKEQSHIAEERMVGLARLTQALEEQSRTTEGLKAELARVTRVLEEQTRGVEEFQQRLEEATEERAKQSQISDATRLGLEQAIRERDDERSLANDRQAALVRLEKILQEQVRLSEQQQEQLTELERARSERNEAESQREAQLEQARKDVAERDRRISELEAEHADMVVRQKRLDQEIFKAEAQLELIKDVILREKAF